MRRTLLFRRLQQNDPWAILLGSVFIALLSLAFALGSNLLRASPLPLIPPFLCESSYSEIDPEQAERWAREGQAVVLDSRSRNQFRKARLPQALNLPPKDFPSLYPLLDSSLPQEKSIIVYGEGWGRPTEKELAYLLQRTGRRQVKILKGGILAWEKKGFRMEGK
jgi:rhodanese-related sulfurtransferase